MYLVTNMKRWALGVDLDFRFKLFIVCIGPITMVVDRWVRCPRD